MLSCLCVRASLAESALRVVCIYRPDAKGELQRRPASTRIACRVVCWAAVAGDKACWQAVRA